MCGAVDIIIYVYRFKLVNKKKPLGFYRDHTTIGTVPMFSKTAKQMMHQ